MRVLIVDDESDIRDILEFTIESEVDCECISASSGNEAIEKIRTEKNFDLILSDYNMPEGNGGTLYKYLLDNGMQVPFALCSSLRPDEDPIFSKGNFFIGNIIKPNIYDGVLSILQKYEEIKDTFTTNLHSVKRSPSEYVGFNLALLKAMDTAFCDIYLKLSEQKYLKVFNKKTEVAKEDIEKYQNKGIEKLYIERESIELFVSDIANHIQTIFLDENLPEEQKTINVFDIVQNTIVSLGLSKSVIKVAAKSVEQTLDLMGSLEDLTSFYNRLFQHSDSFLTKHSIALSYVSAGLLSKTKWDSHESRVKISLASFLHDFSIDNMRIDERGVDLNPFEEKAFDSHAHDAAEVLSEVPEIPEDVNSIIRDHHELPDGTGFPRGLTGTNIKPLVSVFILSHEVVCSMLTLAERNQELTKDKVISLIDVNLYKEGHFKKCLEALDKLELF